jgi:hypothetical protein
VRWLKALAQFSPRHQRTRHEEGVFQIVGPAERSIEKGITEIGPLGFVLTSERRVVSVRRGDYQRISICQARCGRRLDATPEETYTLVLDLLRLAGPNRDRLVKRFASVEQQWGGEDKFSQALKLRDALKADPWVWPKRRPQRGHSPAIVEKILGLMRADVNRFWTNRQLARRVRRSYKSVWHITRSMCGRGLIVVVDEGKGLLALPEACVETRKSVSGRIIEKLIAAREMRFSPLARAIGIDPVAMSTPVQTLRRIGVLEAADSAANPNARPPLRLSAEARAKIARKETIRDRRGFILWTPEADKIGI